MKTRTRGDIRVALGLNQLLHIMSDTHASSFTDQRQGDRRNPPPSPPPMFCPNPSPAPVPAHHWHLRQEVIATIIVAVAGAIVSGLWRFAEVEKKIDLQVQDAVSLHQSDAAMTNQMQLAVATLREDNKDLSRKLDRLIERGVK